MKPVFEINEAKAKALETINASENKPEAIVEALEAYVTAVNAELVERITNEAARAATDKQYAQALGLRTLSAEAKKFYAFIKNPKNSITADQIDIIPTEIVDYSMVDVKKDSGLLSIINFAPANVKKWIVGAKSGVAAWGALTDAIVSELSATISSINFELAKLSVYLLVPKAIRDLADPFVDRYFTAILAEVMRDGLEDGVLNGDGDDMPIGFYNVLATGHAPKAIATSLTGFTPKLLATAKKYLSNSGARAVTELYLVCNPADEADFVAQALFDGQGNMVSSFKNLKVISTPNNTQGQALLVLPKMYTMGFSGIQIKEYKETKALDDVDLIIAKVYANGRPVDDYAAYVFDVTVLAEHVTKVSVVGTVATKEQA